MYNNLGNLGTKAILSIKLIFIFILNINFGYAQHNKADTLTIYTNPETPAEFIGGNDALFKYLTKSMFDKLTFTKEDASNIRTVHAQIIISKKGKVDSVKLMKSSNVKKLDSLFLLTLKNMPDWKPGLMNGKPIRQRMNIPYRVELR